MLLWHATVANPEASRFPCKERPCMPGSQTTSGRAGPRAIAPARVAFRTQEKRRHPRSVIFAVQWLAYTLPCQRFTDGLAAARA
jgi:hypothetical protein